jgi:hypothetical protein
VSGTAAVLVAAGALGAGSGAIAIAVWPGLAGTAHVSAATPLRPAKLADNKQPLTKTETAALVDWAQRYRACAGGRGVALAEPRLRRNEVVLAGAAGPVRRRQLAQALPCIDRLAGPPEHMSFTLDRDGRFHLYRPRACLLPARQKKA